MEIDSNSFSCDIVIEEKFIPDHHYVPEVDMDHQNPYNSYSDIIVEKKFIPDDEPEQNTDIINHQNKDQNPTENNAENNAKSQNSAELFNGQLYKYKCVCNKRYKTHGPFKQHEKICQFQKSNLLVCRVFKCYATFGNQADFEAHKLEGHGKPGTKKSTKNVNKIELIPCDFNEDCTAQFTTKKKLYEHKRAVHTTRKFPCLYCDLTFKKKTSKTRHEQRFHLKETKIQTKIVKNLDKSQGIKGKNGPKIKGKIATNVDTNVGISKIKSEVKKIQTSSGGRLTRSQNKETNFSNFFELDKLTAGNQPESDGDTSTTASFIDEDDFKDISVKTSSDSDENDQILKVSKRVHNDNEKLKPIELQDSSDSEENDQVLDVSKQKKNVKKQFDLVESDEESEYLCSLCHESFTSKIDAKNHEKNCQNVKKSKKIKIDKILELRCEFEDCDKVFKDIGKYNFHIDVVHLKIPQNKCRKKRESDDRGCFLCRKNFKLKKELNDHMKIPHRINCTKCCRSFVESAQLEMHTKYNHSEELKKFKCRKCTKKFMKELAVKKHNQAVHDKKMKICPICSNEVGIFNFYSHLKNHKKNERGVKLFCTTCQVYLAYKRDLEKHMGTELHLKKESDKEEFFLPHDLNTDDSLLITNVKKSDEGIYDPVKDKKLAKSRIYNCHDCGMKFRNFNYLEGHQVKIHGYQKPEFHCTICDMNFSRQSFLAAHIKKSTNHKMKEKEFREKN